MSDSPNTDALHVPTSTTSPLQLQRHDSSLADEPEGLSSPQLSQSSSSPLGELLDDDDDSDNEVFGGLNLHQNSQQLIDISDLDPEDRRYSDDHINRNELDTAEAEQVIDLLGGERLLNMASEQRQRHVDTSASSSMLLPGGDSSKRVQDAAAGNSDDDNGASSCVDILRSKLFSIRTAISIFAVVVVVLLAGSLLAFFIIVNVRHGVSTSVSIVTGESFAHTKISAQREITLPEDALSTFAAEASLIGWMTEPGFLTDPVSSVSGALREHWLNDLSVVGNRPVDIPGEYALRFANDASVASLRNRDSLDEDGVRSRHSDRMDIHIYRPAAGSGYYSSAAAAASSSSTGSLRDVVDASASYALAVNRTTLSSMPSASSSVSNSLLQDERTFVYSPLWNRSFAEHAAAAAAAAGSTTMNRTRSGWLSTWDAQSLTTILNATLLPTPAADNNNLHKQLTARQLSHRLVAVVFRNNTQEAVQAYADGGGSSSGGGDTQQQFALATATIPLDHLGRSLTRHVNVPGAQAFLLNGKNRVVAWSHGWSYELVSATELQARPADSSSSEVCAYAGERKTTLNLVEVMHACLHEFEPSSRSSSSSTMEQDLKFPRETFPLGHFASDVDVDALLSTEFTPSMETLRSAAATVRARRQEHMLAAASSNSSLPFSTTFGIGEHTDPNIADQPEFAVKAESLQTRSNNNNTNFVLVVVYPVAELLREADDARRAVAPFFYVVFFVCLVAAYLLLAVLTMSVEDLAERMVTDPWNPPKRKARRRRSGSKKKKDSGDENDEDEEENRSRSSSSSNSSFWSRLRSCCCCSDDAEPLFVFEEIEQLEEAFASMRRIVKVVRSFMAVHDFDPAHLGDSNIIGLRDAEEQDSDDGGGGGGGGDDEAAMMMMMMGGNNTLLLGGDLSRSPQQKVEESALSPVTLSPTTQEQQQQQQQRKRYVRFTVEDPDEEKLRSPQQQQQQQPKPTKPSSPSSSSPTRGNSNSSNDDPAKLGEIIFSPKQNELLSGSPLTDLNATLPPQQSSSSSLSSSAAAAAPHHQPRQRPPPISTSGPASPTLPLDTSPMRDDPSPEESSPKQKEQQQQQQEQSGPPPLAPALHLEPPSRGGAAAAAKNSSSSNSSSGKGGADSATTTSPPQQQQSPSKSLKERGFVNILAVAANFYGFHSSLENPKELLDRSSVVVTHMTSLMRLLGASLIEWRGDHFSFCIRIKATGYSKLVTRLLQGLMDTAQKIAESPLYMANAGGKVVSSTSITLTNSKSSGEQDDATPSPSSSAASAGERRGSSSESSDADSNPMTADDADSRRKNREEQQQQPTEKTETTPTAAAAGSSSFFAGAKKSLVFSAGVAHGYCRILNTMNSTDPTDNLLLNRRVSILGPCFAEAAALDRFAHHHPCVLARSMPVVPHVIAMRENQLRVLHGAEVELLREAWDFTANGPHRGGGTVIGPRLEYVIAQQQQQQRMEQEEAAAARLEGGGGAVPAKSAREQQLAANARKARHLAIQQAVRSLQPPQGVVRVYHVKIKRTLLNTPVTIPDD